VFDLLAHRRRISLRVGSREGSDLEPLHRRNVRETICYLARLMSKKFKKQKKPAAAPAAVTPEQKLLARQRFLAARALRKRRQRKSHQ
jgi:hypothetical protein